MPKRLLLAVLASCVTLIAQKHELGLTLGRLSPTTRDTSPQSLKLQEGTLLQAVYGLRVASGGGTSFYLNLGVASSPLRSLENRIPMSTRDVASLYVTPALTVKFLPEGRVSPWVTAGGGLAVYEQSRERFDGRPNDARRLLNTGQVMFGGGVDLRVFRWIALRGEVRDFYSGNPDFNVPVSGRQHNLALSGGFVLRFGE